MNIDFNAYNRYVKPVEKNQFNSDIATENNIQNVKGTEKEKVDVISISPKASCVREMNLKAESIVSEIEQSVSSERLSKLKADIQDGSYSVSSQNVAESILNHFSL